MAAHHQPVRSGSASTVAAHDRRHVPSSVVAALKDRGGAARWADLADAASPRRLRRALELGVVTAIAPGVYFLPGTPLPVVTAVVHRGRLTCISAAEHLGIAVLEPPRVPHLAVPRSRGRSGSALRDSHPARLHRAGQDATVEGPPVVPLVEALARMLVCLPPQHALVAVDAALAQGRVTTAAVRAALPDGARAAAVLLSADGRSQSPTETLARLALRAAGVSVEPSVHISGVGWVDLLVERCVVVELDGFAYHSGRKEYREDRRRDRELVRQGFVVLRFTYEDVMRDPQVVVSAVRAVLVRSAARPQPRA